MYSLDSTVDIDTTDSNGIMHNDTMKCSINLTTQTAQWELKNSTLIFEGGGNRPQGPNSNLDKVIASTVTVLILVIVIVFIAIKMRQRNQLNNSQNCIRLPAACFRSLPATAAIGREDSSGIYQLVDKRGEELQH